MGFLDSLIGRTKLPKSNEDKIFAMSTAMLTLQTAAELEPANRIGIVFRSLPSGRFQQLNRDTVEMLKIQDQASPTDNLKVNQIKDDLGFQWLVVGGP
ncbi:MAG: PspA-associated protein PspAB, partial [Candidatus Dormibacteria bacterium]